MQVHAELELRMLGFTADRHIPQPVRSENGNAEEFAASGLWEGAMRAFLRGPHLPHELAAR
ncbi:hypothetical protein [Streptomyces sp. NBC_01431]|uniref:hypothetical protein n=1 Tax=Streptomyces sp. NBC_01431 TaxID=2903863 RepID=UPI002E332320|nr:hypothetical protein [Streptomyces sp. NBC_01431]